MPSTFGAGEKIKRSIEKFLFRIDDPKRRDQMRFIFCGDGDEWGSLSRGMLAGLLAGEGRGSLLLARSIELSHHASLIVDDYIDKAKLRRGVDAFWVRYGAEECILFSHLMVCMALEEFLEFDRVCGCHGLAQRYALEAVYKMATTELEARKEPVLDLAGYLRRIRGKTGSLYGLVARLASLAPATTIADADRCVDALSSIGDARQMLDDFTDARPDELNQEIFVTSEAAMENRRQSIYSLLDHGHTIHDLRSIHREYSRFAIGELLASINSGSQRDLIIEVCCRVCLDTTAGELGFLPETSNPSKSLAGHYFGQQKRN